MNTIDPRIIDQFNKNAPFNLDDAHLVVLTLVGSHSHGTHIPSNEPTEVKDVDYMGVVIPPISYVLGLETWKTETVKFQFEDLDCTFHSLNKFARLSLKANPDIMGLMWVNLKHVVYRTYMWDHIVNNRNKFLSRMVHQSFTNYTKDQLNRMIVDKTNRDMGEKRKKLVEQFGYDVKQASHVIRLASMCLEILETGNVYVDRTDLNADALKHIKQGKWTIGQVRRYASKLLDASHLAVLKSPLPETPDYDFVNNLMRQTYLEAYDLYYRPTA